MPSSSVVSISGSSVPLSDDSLDRELANHSDSRSFHVLDDFDNNNLSRSHPMLPDGSVQDVIEDEDEYGEWDGIDDEEEWNGINNDNTTRVSKTDGVLEPPDDSLLFESCAALLEDVKEHATFQGYAVTIARSRWGKGVMVKY